MEYNKEENSIITDNLILRKFEYEDATEIAKFLNNENIYRVTQGIPYPYTEDDALAWVASHKFNFEKDFRYNFGITDRKTGELYGGISLSNYARDKSGEVGYWIGEEFWGQGYCTEATKAILWLAFYEKNYNKVFARHFFSNPASGRVMQKNFMVKEGVLKQHIKKGDRFEDIVCYGILKEEFVKKQNV